MLSCFRQSHAKMLMTVENTEACGPDGTNRSRMGASDRKWKPPCAMREPAPGESSTPMNTHHQTISRQVSMPPIFCIISAAAM
jgi:hypothetical protein